MTQSRTNIGIFIKSTISIVPFSSQVLTQPYFVSCCFSDTKTATKSHTQANIMLVVEMLKRYMWNTERVQDARRSLCHHMSGLLPVDHRIHQSHQLGSRTAYLTLAVLIAICYRRAQMSVDTVSPDWGWAEGAAANVAWRRRMAARVGCYLHLKVICRNGHFLLLSCQPDWLGSTLISHLSKVN